MGVDLTQLWDFDDPAGSERRFRVMLRTALGVDRPVLSTQVARALGLQEKYAEGHLVLDEVADLDSPDPEVATRLALERGRLLRSSGDGSEALPLFEAAAAAASAAGLEALHVDALHMVALAVPPEERVAAGERALAVARAASDTTARDWDASLLNNIGMAHADADDFTAALRAFEEALAARERIGDDARTRVARWMVGWALRNLGRDGEALAVQEALEADLAAAGLTDPYVEEELALLYRRSLSADLPE